MIKKGIKETTSVVKIEERNITVLYTSKIQIQITHTSKKKGEERYVCRVIEERNITVLYTSKIQIQSTHTSKTKGAKANDKMIKRGIKETTSVEKKKEKRDMYVESEKRDI
jgi:hypothetical protein